MSDVESVWQICLQWKWSEADVLKYIANFTGCYTHTHTHTHTLWIKLRAAQRKSNRK